MGINFFIKNMYIFVATSQSSSKAVSSPIGRHLMETESSNIFFFGVLNNNIYEKKRIGLNFIDENNYFKAFRPHHQEKKN